MNCYYELGEYTKAEDYADKTASIFLKLKAEQEKKEKVQNNMTPETDLVSSQTNTLNSYSKLIKFYRDKGDYEKAEEYANTKAELSMTFKSLTELEKEMKQYDATDMVSPSDQYSICSLYYQLAGIYLEKGNFEKSKDITYKAMKLYSKNLVERVGEYVLKVQKEFDEKKRPSPHGSLYELKKELGSKFEDKQLEAQNVLLLYGSLRSIRQSKILKAAIEERKK